MQSAAQAYSTVAQQIVSPRELEADLLLKAARDGNSCRVGRCRSSQVDFGGSGLNASAVPLMQ